MVGQGTRIIDHLEGAIGSEEQVLTLVKVLISTITLITILKLCRWAFRFTIYVRAQN